MSAGDSDRVRVEIGIAVVERAGQYLVGRRPESISFAGYWEFPGGKCKANETPADAARRECLEETGLAVEMGPLLAEVEHSYPHGPVRLWFFAARVQATESPLPERFRWTDRAALGSMSFPAANAAVVEKLVRLTDRSIEQRSSDGWQCSLGPINEEA